MNDLTNNILLPVISFIIVLGPLILIHELGHFIALKLVGVTVLEFGIGFPPRAVKLFERDGTIFSLNWLPIGGFVRPLGEDFVKPVGEGATEKEREAFEQHIAEVAALNQKHIKTKSLLETGPWQRIFFFIAGITMNLIGAFVLLMLVALLGKPGPAIAVVGVSPNSPAEQAGLKVGDAIIAVNGQPVTSIDQANKIPDKADKSIDIVYLRDNQTHSATVNQTTNPLRLSGIYIDSVAPNSPAATAGLQTGDVILQVDQRKVTTANSLVQYVTAHGDQTITLIYERNDQQQTIQIVPRSKPPQGEGPLGVEILEVQYDGTYGWALNNADKGQLVKYPLGQAIVTGAQDTWTNIKLVFGAPFQIISGAVPLSQARPGSIVAISQIGGDVLKNSINAQEPYPILNFAALISISLAFVNLLPIPGLDGGRILFVIVELLRGKPMDPEREGLVHMIGLMVLLALSAILIVNDIINPIIRH